jgi:hypothetical protein
MWHSAHTGCAAPKCFNPHNCQDPSFNMKSATHHLSQSFMTASTPKHGCCTSSYSLTRKAQYPPTRAFWPDATCNYIPLPFVTVTWSPKPRPKTHIWHNAVMLHSLYCAGKPCMAIACCSQTGCSDQVQHSTAQHNTMPHISNQVHRVCCASPVTVCLETC